MRPRLDKHGSLITTTDHAGAVTQRYAYDPFGKRRYTNGSYDAFGNLVIDWSPAVNAGTARGFTGHEQLDDIGLVNMNGRIFDPTLGLFLQGDPMLQAPGNLQNYNRYGYCYNNPMGCTDPSGFCSFFCGLWHSLWDNKAIRSIAAIAVAYYIPGSSSLFGPTGIFGEVSAIGQSAIAGFASGAVSSGNIKGALQGAFTAGVFTGVGNVIQGGDFFAGGGTPGSFGGVGGRAGAVALHAVAGCVTSAASGGKCSSGAMSAAFSEAATVNGLQFKGAAGVISAAVIGGTASVLGGGKFANGAQAAAFGYLFNYCGQGHGTDCFKSLREMLSDSPAGKLWNSVFGSNSAPSSIGSGQAGASIAAHGIVGGTLGAQYVVDNLGACSVVVEACATLGPGVALSAQPAFAVSNQAVPTDTQFKIGAFGKVMGKELQFATDLGVGMKAEKWWRG